MPKTKPPPKHTPRPWEAAEGFDRHTIFGPDMEVIGEIRKTGGTLAHRGPGNLSLVLAAPDLADAMDRIVAYVKGGGRRCAYVSDIATGALIKAGRIS